MGGRLLIEVLLFSVWWVDSIKGKGLRWFVVVWLHSASAHIVIHEHDLVTTIYLFLGIERAAPHDDLDRLRGRHPVRPLERKGNIEVRTRATGKNNNKENVCMKGRTYFRHASSRPRSHLRHAVTRHPRALRAVCASDTLPVTLLHGLTRVPRLPVARR